MGLLEGGFGSPRMAELVSWHARIAHMLSVETALARALAQVGLIGEADAEAVAVACAPTAVDLEALAGQAPEASTPVTALLRQVRDGADDRVAEALHRGATSQDIMDTAMVLAVRDALGLLTEELLATGHLLADLADEHRSTLAVGRTLGQHAVPITQGLRFARWLGAIDRHVTRLDGVRADVLVLQLGGAAGTLAAWGADGLEVAAALGDELDLDVPDLPWHAERDRIAVLAGQLTALVGTVDTIAAELVRLAATEVGEVRYADAGGSSAMPHKANPTGPSGARAGARLARAELVELTAGGSPVEHERAAGTWQAEWVLLPSALVRTAGAVEALRRTLGMIDVDGDRSWDNLANGHWVALGEALQTALLGRTDRASAAAICRDVADEARRTGAALPDVAATDARVTDLLTAEDLARALDPVASLPMIHALVDRSLSTHHRTVGERRP